MPSKARFRSRVTPGALQVQIGILKGIYDFPVNKAGQVFYGPENILNSPSVDPLMVERSWDETHEGPPYLSGGPLSIIKAQLSQHAIKGAGTYNGPPGSIYIGGQDSGHYQYAGGCSSPSFPSIIGEIAGSAYTSSDSNQVLLDPRIHPSLASIGSGAYDRLRPQLSRSGLSVALAEARDIPKMLRTSSSGFHNIWTDIGGSTRGKTMAPKKIGDHFLNTQFGWVPFIKDIRSFHDTYINSGKYIDQLIKDNNQWIKRRRTDKKVESEVVLASGSGQRCHPLANFRIISCLSATPSYQVILRTSTQVWYEGRFKYYRPEFDAKMKWHNTPLGDIYRYTTLFGARINPSNVYKVIPWSWLVDWFSNVGAVIDRANDWALDGIVSQYMYLMHYSVREVVLQVTVPWIDGPKICEWPRYFDVKRREGASSSYGFSLSEQSLSPRQLAILGALGISRT